MDASPTSLDLDPILGLLESTPRVLRALLGGLPEAWLAADEGAGTFSARDVLGHLILGERTDWVPRLRIVLAEGEGRAFEPFDRFGFAEIVAGRSVGELLDTFETERAANVQAVRELDLGPDELALRGRHPELGAVTAGELLSTWAVHDLGHLRQIARVLAKVHADAVGPWRAYLSILGE